MINRNLGIPGVLLGVLIGSFAQFVDEQVMRDPNGFMTECKRDKESLYDSLYEFITLDNKTENISSYYGNVLLIVNVATY